MTCVSCVISLETLFDALPAFKHSSSSVSVSLLPQKVIATYQASSTNVEEIQNVVLDAGFEIVLSSTEPVISKKKFSSTVDVLISGMTCASCSASIERSLRNLGGIIEIGISVVNGKAKIEFDPHKIGQRDFLDAINDMGFDAVLDDSLNNQEVF
jgi:Cu+-exporting ATPase